MTLCIVQDSEDDWKKEAALMTSVYSGSTLNIAASSALDSSHGLFLTTPRLSEGCEAKIMIDATGDFQLQDSYSRAVTDSHLATRAWALQEKLLPYRTLHFGDRGVFWECRTDIASENLPCGVIDTYPSNLMVCQRDHRDGLAYRKDWAKIVFLYSSANLTKNKDKLPALSGIARLFHEQNDDQYLVGLWKKPLAYDLCWRSRDPAQSRLPYRAPTWSWASMDVVVFYHSHDSSWMADFAHILDADIVLDGPDPFGEVKSGVVRLACSVIAAGAFTDQKTIRIEVAM